MKKLIAVFILATLMFTALAVIPANAAQEFDYVHIVASGNDPYATIRFNSSGNNTTIDPDTVKWAVIKYRTVTETDNTGVQLIGQFYILSAAEPFVPIKYNHTREWETLVVDLTSVSVKTQLASAWNSTKYTDKTGIRFDPLESNRDAEAATSESDTAVVSDGDSIDIAFIAFFDNEADAQAYDGTQNTPYCIILPEDLEWYEGGNAIAEVEYVEGKKPRPTTDRETTEAPKDDTTEEATTPAETDPVTQEQTTENTTNKPAETTDPAETTGGSGSASSGLPLWSVILIVVGAVVLVAAIVAVVVKKKK